MIYIYIHFPCGFKMFHKADISKDTTVWQVPLTYQLLLTHGVSRGCILRCFNFLEALIRSFDIIWYHLITIRSSIRTVDQQSFAQFVICWRISSINRFNCPVLVFLSKFDSFESKACASRFAGWSRWWEFVAALERHKWSFEVLDPQEIHRSFALFRFLGFSLSSTNLQQMLFQKFSQHVFFFCVSGCDYLRVHVPFVRDHWPLKSILREKEADRLCGGSAAPQKLCVKWNLGM